MFQSRKRKKRKIACHGRVGDSSLTAAGEIVGDDLHALLLGHFNRDALHLAFDVSHLFVRQRGEDDAMGHTGMWMVVSVKNIHHRITEQMGSTIEYTKYIKLKLCSIP